MFTLMTSAKILEGFLKNLHSKDIQSRFAYFWNIHFILCISFLEFLAIGQLFVARGGLKEKKRKGRCLTVMNLI